MDPTKYMRSFSFSGFQETNPTAPLPGPAHDNEYENIEQAINGSIDALRDIRRSDGALKNGIVTPDSLSPSLNIGFTFRGLWELGESYSGGDGAVHNGVFYAARVSHVATALNAPNVSPATWSVLFAAADIAVAGALLMPVFSGVGDGVTTAFNLGFVPRSATNLLVKVGGVLQDITEYGVPSGSTIQFFTPPPSGYGIEVRGFATTAATVEVPDGSVNYEKMDPIIAALIQGSAQKSANLSDLADKAVALTNLGVPAEANTFLRRNAANTGFDTLTPSEVGAAIGIPEFETVANAQALTSPFLGNAILLTDPLTAMRKGWYKKVAVEPTHPHKFQVAGEWFEMDPEQELKSTMFGIPLDDTGSSDRKQALTDMLVHAAGRPAFLKRGKYRVNSPIVIDYTQFSKYPGAFWWPGPQLIGEGSDKSVIMTAAASAPAIKFWNGGDAFPQLSEGTVLKGLRIEKVAGTTAPSGIELSGATRFEVANIYTDGMFDGLVLSSNGGVETDINGDGNVHDNYFGSNGRNGIRVHPNAGGGVPATHVDLARNFINGADVGILLGAVEQVNLHHNKVLTCATANVHIAYAAGTQNANVKMIGNELGNNTANSLGLVCVESLLNGRFENNRFVRNSGEVGSFGYYARAITNAVVKNTSVVQDQWVISGAAAFTPYNADSGLNGRIKIVDHDYKVFVPTTTPRVNGDKWGDARNDFSGAGVVTLNVDEARMIYFTLTGTSGTTFSLSGHSANGDECDIIVVNPTPTSTGFNPDKVTVKGVSVTATLNTRSSARFRYYANLSTWMQIGPWLTYPIN